MKASPERERERERDRETEKGNKMCVRKEKCLESHQYTFPICLEGHIKPFVITHDGVGRNIWGSIERRKIRLRLERNDLERERENGEKDKEKKKKKKKKRKKNLVVHHGRGPCR
jgi:hypothetical protein